jgi:predicted transcriptional regulator
MIYGFEDLDLQEVEPLMMQKEICQLPVLSHDKKCVGMVTLDLARKTAPVQTG